MKITDGTPLTDVGGDSQGWDRVRIEVDNVVASSTEPFEQDTIANVRDLLAICGVETPVPTNVGKGYWNTICLSWTQFEIEVLEDRFEVYHFHDQHSDIWYEEHRPGNAFTPRFLTELAGLTDLLNPSQK